MSKPLLIISGPTATGKTALAVRLAKKYHGELVSADSRQIYKELNIGVGKDHPKNTPIHLVDVISPRQTFSAGQYRQLALSAIDDIYSRGKLPILVGCTGFYIDSVIDPRPTFSIKPNIFLRSILNRLPLIFLQKLHYLLDKESSLSLNHSDKNNPYRLVRKIEITLSPHPPSSTIHNLRSVNYLHLSLTAPNQFLYRRIDDRVKERLKIGHLKELNSLLQKYSWSNPGLQISCYKAFKSLSVKGEIERTSSKEFQEAVQCWKYAEHRDARHQKTWFSKRPDTSLIDISRPTATQKINQLVDQWYNKL